jgi:HlyD family secretion protein
MRGKRRWILWIVILLAVVAGGTFLLNNTEQGQELLNQLPFGQDDAGESARTGQSLPDGAERPTLTPEELAAATVAIQPASNIIGEVSASGNIALADQRSVVAEVEGTVTSIDVDAGDLVERGDLLVLIDPVDLERAVQRAELDVKTSQNELAQLMEETGDADIAVAEANLAEAQENLADVQAGPSNEAVAAARASVTSSWAKYNELLAGSSDAQLTQLSADMRKKEVALAEAQRAYDAIAWRNDSAATAQAAELEQATIDYESSAAAFDESTAPAETSDIQSAYSSAQDAQSKLDDLLNSPTPAEIASAEATVVDAQATLDRLLKGPSETEMEEVLIALEKSLVDLEEAHNDLAKAYITAPLDGAVVGVDTELGQRVSKGAVVVLLTDPAALELTIEVAEIDIPQVQIGQPASIAIDAFSGKTYDGTVESISFTSDSSSGLVNYPVTIQLDEGNQGENLDGVLPGMTAVATLANMDEAAADGWLVPSNAIRDRGDGQMIMVLDEGQPSPVPVTTGAIQGEWTVVYSPELEQGDMVMGSVTSFIGDDEGDFRGFGGGRPPGGGNR